MPGPFTYPVAEAVPFEPSRNPDFNGEVGTLVAENAQDAIEEVFNNAPGTKARFAAVSAYKGVASNRFLEFFDSISSDKVPFVMAEPGEIKSLSVAVSVSTTATLTIFKNGISVETITITASKKATKTGLSISLAADDELSTKVTSGNMKDVISNIFIQVTA